MNNLYVGFSRVIVTPKMGVALDGYYQTRLADKVLDDLEINAIALKTQETCVLMLSLDNNGLMKETANWYRQSISSATGVSAENVFIAVTHCHNAPVKRFNDSMTLEMEYYQWLEGKMKEAAVQALSDLKPAKMGYGVGQAPNVAFVRRFRMKDGSTRTNPGVNNPDILAPIGQPDESVGVLRFDRENAPTVILVNFANHPDTVGTCAITADWCGILRRTVEKTLDNTKCLFFNGAEGDVNHVNVAPTKGFLNGLHVDFDDVARGYSHAEYIGRVITGGVLQVYDKVEYIDVDEIRCMQETVRIPANLPRQEDLPNAHRINELYKAGRSNELPYEGMALTTVLAEAARMVRLENASPYFEMELLGISLGEVAILGIPGEPFTQIGRELKATPNWKMVLPTALVNGFQGYFPTKDAYDEGGYEAKASNFKAGVGELIIEEGKKLLAKLQ